MEDSASVSISVKDLKKKHGNLEVLRGIDLQVFPGQLTVLIGPSGCGKSTLLRCLNGLETLDSGTINVNGIILENTQNSKNAQKSFDKNARLIRENVGMVFQSYNLFPHLTLLENVTIAPVVVKKMNKDLAKHNAHELLLKVGLERHKNHYPAELSGGQQQRGAIARALALSPKAILYDEPTSSLDPDLVNEVLQVMRTLDDEGMTQIVVTHEMKFARDVADQVVHLQDGRIVAMGTSHEFFSSPADARTRYFLRSFLLS